MMHQREHGVRMTLFAAVLAVGTAGCPQGGSQGPGTSNATGTGTITVDGTAREYTVVPEESELLLLVQKVDAPACSFFHDHAVAAGAVAFEFSLDRANPSGSTLTARVPAAGLMVDLPEHRNAFPETAGTTFTERERQDIRANMLNQVGAPEHPTLTFTARNLSTLDGEGSAEVTADIKGTTSTLTMTASARWEGDRLVMEGTAPLDGAPHGMPTGTFNACIEPVMQMKMRIVLAPGSNNAEVPDAGTVQEWTRTHFPEDEGSCGTVGYDDVKATLLTRCAGCHNDPPQQGATVPLLTLDDYRHDSLMSQGVPLYVDAADRIRDTGGRKMPPEGSTPLTDEETQRILAWADEGGHARSCNTPSPDAGTMTPDAGGTTPDAGTTTPDAGNSDPPDTCDPIGYADIAPIMSTHCTLCHRAGGPSVPLDTHAAGNAPATHPAYAGMTLWEVSAARIEDGSMPPGGRVSDADQDLLRRWVDQGAPLEACTPQ